MEAEAQTSSSFFQKGGGGGGTEAKTILFIIKKWELRNKQTEMLKHETYAFRRTWEDNVHFSANINRKGIFVLFLTVLLLLSFGLVSNILCALVVYLHGRWQSTLSFAIP